MSPLSIKYKNGCLNTEKHISEFKINIYNYLTGNALNVTIIKANQYIFNDGLCGAAA